MAGGNITVNSSLTRFLQQYKCEPGDIPTHTSIDGGSFRIPQAAYGSFVDEYCKSLESGCKLSLTERPGVWFPVIVDIDLKFNCGSEESVRSGVLGVLNDIIRAYAVAIHSMVHPDSSDTTVTAYTMQRSRPHECGGCMLKDGLHIVFPAIVMTKYAQRIVREKAIEAIDGTIRELPGITESTEMCVDDCYCMKGTNWQLYGSSKPSQRDDPYLITKVSSFIFRDGEVSNAIHEKLPDASMWSRWMPKFSVRDIPLHKLTRLNDRAQERAVAIEDDEIRQILILHKERMPEMFSNETKCDENEVDFKLVKDLVDCLDPKRSSNYDTWIRVGWCLRNTSYKLVDQWLRFSSMSPKFNERECRAMWDSMKCDKQRPLTIASLKMWARQDNPDKYESIVLDQRSALFKEILLNCTTGDISKLFISMFPHEFVSVKVSNTARIFYQFKDHRYQVDSHETEIKNRLEEEVLDEITRWANKNMDMDNKSDASLFKKVKLTLKNCNPREVVVKDIGEKLLDADFESHLDENRDVFGFNNGVYDFRNKTFRDGKPEDKLTLTCGHDYIVGLSDDNEVVKEILTFFSQLHRSSEVREYVQDVLCTLVSGHNPEEHFYYFTGSGSNGKSKLIELVEKALGKYCTKLPTSLITQRRAEAGKACSELASTKGKRFTVFQEPGPSEHLNVGIMKEMTGGDSIQTRALYREPVVFKPQFKMVMTCNTLNQISATDGGTWRRIRVVTFDSKFVSSPDPNTEEQPMDPRLTSKLEIWAPYLATMLVNRFATFNDKVITEPAEISKATYSYRCQTDIETDFITTYLNQTNDKDDLLAVTDVLRLYKTSGYGRQRITRLAMVEKLKQTVLESPDYTDCDLGVYRGWNLRNM